MLIDNTIRKRWGFLPQKPQEWDEEESPTDLEINPVASSQNEETARFRVSAKEWLCTWRAIE